MTSIPVALHVDTLLCHTTPRSLAQRDDDSIPSQAEHQPRPLRLQMQDHTRLVLQLQIASTRRADRKAVAGLAVGAGKLPEVA